MNAARQASMKARWERLLGEWGAPPREGMTVFDDLVNRYSESHRHYHTLDHIAHCLREYDALPDGAKRPEFEGALWFHDAIYDPDRPDNEAASAVLARETLRKLGCDAAALNDVETLILATDHRHPPKRPDEKLIVDVDLSILGQPDTSYDHYAAAIRQEYHHIPEPAYRQGRAAVLRRFLDQSTIFSTPDFQERLETRARENLERELGSLG